MKLLLNLMVLLFPVVCFSQSNPSYRKQIKAQRMVKDEQFKNPSISPLPTEAIPSFQTLNYFKPKRKYLIKAKLIKTPGSKPFEMPTTTDRKPVYLQYGILKFNVGSKPYELKIYQSQDARRNPLRRNLLFLPFKDSTNGSSSYGGGRFIDLQIPKGDEIFIDFNLAYNPYCVYDASYSCPIVPSDNHLKLRIPAGEKRFQ